MPMLQKNEYQISQDELNKMISNVVCCGISRESVPEPRWGVHGMVDIGIEMAALFYFYAKMVSKKRDPFLEGAIRLSRFWWRQYRTLFDIKESEMN